MLQPTPTLPTRGGPPKALTGVIKTVVGSITVTTADQLPEQSDSTQPANPAAPRRLSKLETAQLMKDRHEWMSKVDQFTIEEATEWNQHKEALKRIANMTTKEKIELFERLRKLAQSYGIGWKADARLFYMLPLPGDSE